MNPEKFSQSVPESMTEKQKELSEAREAWFNRLEEKGLTPENSFLEISDIYKEEKKRTGVSYADTVSIKGTLTGKTVRIITGYRGRLPFNHDEGIGWKPAASQVESIEIDNELIAGEEAKKVAERLMPLVMPFLRHGEYEARNEIKEHHEWEAGKEEREKNKKESEERERVGRELEAKGLRDIYNILGVESVDIDKLKGRYWGSYTYKLGAPRHSEEEDAHMTEPQQDMSFDRETWLKSLKENFGMGPNEITLKIDFHYFRSLPHNYEDIKRFGVNHKIASSEFSIAGKIKGLTIKIEGVAYTGEGNHPRGLKECSNYDVSKVFIGDTEIPPSYGYRLASLLDSIAEPDLSASADDHQSMQRDYERGEEQKKKASSLSSKLDDLLGGE